MVVIRTIQDGPEITLVHVYLQCDTGVELANVTLLDPALLAGYQPGNRLEVQDLMYDFMGFDAAIFFGTGLPTNAGIWVLPEGSGSGKRNFRPWGNLRDWSGLDGTGRLLITTTGFTSVEDQGTLLLRVRKNVYPIVPV